MRVEARVTVKSGRVLCVTMCASRACWWLFAVIMMVVTGVFWLDKRCVMVSVAGMRTVGVVRVVELHRVAFRSIVDGIGSQIRIMGS